MNIFIFILVFGFTIQIIYEFINIIDNGICSNDEIEKYYSDIDSYILSVSSDYLYKPKSYFYIRKCNSLLFRYKIDNIGLIPRYSKYHYIIKKRFNGFKIK